VALDFGAFIVPVGAGAAPKGVRAIDPLGPLGELHALQPDLLSAIGFPDLLREGRASAQRRSHGGLSGVRKVLGQQVTISDLDGGGGLTFGNLPLLALTLVLFSSLLLVGAVLPPGVIARARFSPADFARFRQPLALAAIGILVPVAVVALLVALS
jgi:hypothetical protein